MDSMLRRGEEKMGNELLKQLNGPLIYLVVAVAILGVVSMCVFFLVKSWRAGLRIGMDRQVLKKVVVSSATFTVLPAVSILLGVIALSGSMGIPLPWLRLSVIGNLQYEVNVADIAARGVGLTGLNIAEMTAEAYVTMALVMTCGILGGALLCLFTLKGYAKKLRGKKPQPQGEVKGESKKSFGDYAMIAMFVGMCATYIGSYVGKAVQMDFLPIVTALIAAVCMAVCEVLEQKYRMKSLENFDLALCMLIAMAGAVLISPMLG